MAWSSAAVDAAIVAATAADKPMFLGENHLRIAAAEWRHGIISTWADTDKTDADFPTKRIRDGLVLGTQPDAPSSATTYAIIFDFGAGGIDFDTIAIMGIGDRSAASGIVEIADDSAYTANLQTIWDFSAETSYRYAKTFALRYSGVQYMRIKLVASAIDYNIDEILIGERHQLFYGQVGNYNPDAIGSDIEKATTRGGVITNYQQASGYFEQGEEFQIENSGETVTQFWEDIARGGQPYCYWENPGSAINAFRLMVPSAEKLPLNHDGPTMRRWMVEAREQGPKYLVDYP